MTSEDLFAEHINRLSREFNTALFETHAQDCAVLIHSGRSHLYFADDHAVPFRAWGHYLRWVPVDRPNQFVLVRPGRKPVFYAIIAKDYWHDQHMDMPQWWASVFEVVVLDSADQLPAQLKQAGSDPDHLIFLGEGLELARLLGVAAQNCNPPALLNWLDYQRAYKSPYEVHRLSEANEQALTGHQAALDAFLAGADEYGIHMAYLQACRMLDHELPYPSIVALNHNGAVLHYQHKRRRSAAPRPDLNQVLLIDAGCRSFGYCSDITRTWGSPGTHPVFMLLLAAMNRLQREVISAIRPGMSYVDLHLDAHQRLAKVLIDAEICRGTAEDLLAQQITAVFLPHGLGHLLGLQVHDVAGRMTAPDGRITLPPALFPALRTTRMVEEDMVFTIEPGLYFIPMLLEPLRHDRRSQLINWKLVDELLPLGGIRIEDNIWISGGIACNLTTQPLDGWQIRLEV
jgi:Xaa-Pro dipeptidase